MKNFGGGIKMIKKLIEISENNSYVIWIMSVCTFFALICLPYLIYGIQ